MSLVAVVAIFVLGAAAGWVGHIRYLQNRRGGMIR